MKTIAMAMMVAGALAVGGVAAAKGGALDGKSFDTLVGDKGKPGSAETLTFKDGKFHSKACDAYGFGKFFCGYCFMNCSGVMRRCSSGYEMCADGIF